jgi:hypothetical protein
LGTTIWKKGNDLFDAITHDLIRAVQQQFRYMMLLMGTLKGIRPNLIKLCLKIAHIFGNPKR